MNDLWPQWILLGVLLALPLGAALHPDALADEFPLACTVDYRAPAPPELLRKAGIRRVYIGMGQALKSDAAGKRVLDEKLKPDLDKFFALYREGGVKVLLNCNFYTRPPKGAECVDAAGRTIAMACLSNPDFLNAMSNAIRDLATVFGDYPAFDGFLFDDGVHVRVDCCYCALCKRLFKEKHGLEPPPFEPYAGDARLDPKDVRLLWDEFHRAAYANHMRVQAEAAVAVSKNLMRVTIPSDSFFYGRHLNMEVARNESPLRHDARLQRMDHLHVRDWRVFQSFPCPKVVAGSAGLEPYATGCHLTAPSPGMIFHADGPLIETQGRQQFLSPAEISRMMRVTVAEGARRICFWNSPRPIAAYPDGFDAIGLVKSDARRLAPLLDERRPYPARVGLLYSTVTEVVQQPWRLNTLERWRHLHAFEAMAYALTRNSVQFAVVFDNELDDAALARLNVLILTGVTHLARPAAEAIEKRIAAGKLLVLSDRGCLPVKGAEPCSFDPDYWLNQQLKGYRQVRYLDRQADEIRKAVLSRINPDKLQPLTVSDGACFAKIFHGGDSLLVFVVNWDTWQESTARLRFSTPCAVRDELAERDLGRFQTLELKIAPAGWQVLRCTGL